MYKLLDVPWWYYEIAVLIGLIVGRAWRWEGGLLVGYLFLILAETIFLRRGFEGKHFQPELFWSWREWNVQREQILTNIAMFIPFGMLAGLIWKWKGLLAAAGLSVGVEALQFLSKRGLCELDDVIHNMIGAASGIAIVIMIRLILGVIDERNQKNR